MSKSAWWQRWRTIGPRQLFLASVFLAPFSLPAARLFLALTLLALLIHRGSRPYRLRLTASFWFWMLYTLTALYASWQGLDPVYSLENCTKFLWFMGIPIAATLVRNRQDTIQVLQAYVLGALVRSLDILLVRVWEAYQAAEGDFLWQVIDRGSMTHGQVLLLAILAAVGLWSTGHMPYRWWAQKAVQAALLLILAVAQVINFKRGSWVVTGVMLGLFSVLNYRWKWLCGLLALLILTALLPPVQQRVLQLRDELDLQHGGRLVMWTKIAPELLRQHPMGVGFRGVQEDLMQETARSLGVRVEENRNHLHSNLVEIPVTLGWGGLWVFVLWMGCAVFSGLRASVCLRSSDPEASLLALTCSLMLMGLLLNGLVEYNMGDSYLILMYGILLGILGRGTSPFLPPESSLPAGSTA